MQSIEAAVGSLVVTMEIVQVDLKILLIILNEIDNITYSIYIYISFICAMPVMHPTVTFRLNFNIYIYI